MQVITAGSSRPTGQPYRRSVVFVRVVAGKLGGRRLVAPPGAGTRPTSDRVREAVFNALHSLAALEGASVVDLFAGSGAMGVEALSRGAAHCVFVDSSPDAIAAINANLLATGLGEHADVTRGDALALAGQLGHVDLVLADPPYEFATWPQLFGVLDASVVVAESDRSIVPGRGWRTVREKRYGGTVVSIVVSDGHQATE